MQDSVGGLALSERQPDLNITPEAATTMRARSEGPRFVDSQEMVLRVHEAYGYIETQHAHEDAI